MKKWWNWILAVALICLLFIAIPISLSKNKEQMYRPMFDEYVEKFNKSYKNKTDEYETRFQHFMASMEEIERLNAESRGPDDHRARYGLTKLSDMSKAEYREIHLSDEKVTKHPSHYGKTWKDRRKNHTDDHKREPGDQITNNVYVIIGRQKRAALPMQVDWRTKGAVGPVRDQGMCGACWAFSTVGAMESMAAINTGKMTTLSVQEVIDCAGLGNNGCAGGDICVLLDWLAITDTAVETDSQYPLRLLDGACRLPANATGVRLSSFTCDDLVANEGRILQMLATHGPVAVAVNALTWQNYLGGVVQYHCSGAKADLNHAVQLVGYDLTKDIPYYIAKNSWGTEFGINGYLHLAIGSNICGLANEVASVDVI
ncbi:cathepsin O-like [Pectinophora gossypiella]|nr:cathepsin O-like [Pectinophora gossypiella]